MDTGRIWIIKEIYDKENDFDKLSDELDLALKQGVSTIVIEPLELAEHTGKWIAVGNFFHRAAVLLGLSSIICYYFLPRQTPVYVCLGGCSFFCTTIHTISWQSDPCSKYQVERNKRKLQRLRIPCANTAVVLRKCNDEYWKYLHISVSILSISVCIYGVCRHRA